VSSPFFLYSPCPEEMFPLPSSFNSFFPPSPPLVGSLNPPPEAFHDLMWQPRLLLTPHFICRIFHAFLGFFFSLPEIKVFFPLTHVTLMPIPLLMFLPLYGLMSPSCPLEDSLLYPNHLFNPLEKHHGPDRCQGSPLHLFTFPDPDAYFHSSRDSLYQSRLFSDFDRCPVLLSSTRLHSPADLPTLILRLLRLFFFSGNEASFLYSKKGPAFSFFQNYTLVLFRLVTIR